MNNKSYMEIDSIENPVNSLESILFFLLREDNIKWKWVLFALHHSLYMFCIANLEGSNYTQVLTKDFNEDNKTCVKKGDGPWKKSKKVYKVRGKGYTLEWEPCDEPENDTDSESNNNNRKEKLIGIWTALARVQDEFFWMSRYTFSKHLVLTDNEWDSIHLLVRYRNELQHFVPVHWAFEIGIFEKICLDVLKVIEFLALVTGQILYPENDENFDVENDDSEIKENEYKIKIKKIINMIRVYLS
ncbi:MAG: hypothetical protein ISS16_11320 [Ignavibacteria bacterium]|nr:hypothetical protein [Ignavibacteria bacterium]